LAFEKVLNANRLAIDGSAAREVEPGVCVGGGWVAGEVARSTEVLAYHADGCVNLLIRVVCGRAVTRVLSKELVVKRGTHVHALL
jgi:hypothetical protein